MKESERRRDKEPDELAREGAAWFARMRGPDAAASEAEFEDWLAQDGAHRGAYNRAAEIFAMGKLLADPGPAPASAPAMRPQSRRTLSVAMVAAGTACILAAGAWLRMHDEAAPGAANDRADAGAVTLARQSLTTRAGRSRTMTLPDHSTVRLAENSTLEVAFDHNSRRLRLLRGAARFAVAHEHRPFVVLAGGGSVTARGTLFDVALTPLGHVDVHLLRGTIDVAPPPQAGAATTAPIVQRLTAGERVSFAARAPTPLASPAMSDFAAAIPSVPQARDFAGIPVAELVAEANRGAARPIRLANPEITGQRVSGRFRIDDTELLARRLAVLFGGTVDLKDPRAIVLKP